MATNSNYKFEIVCSLRRVNELIKSNILWSEENLIYKQSVYTELLIRLKDLLVKANKINCRVDFKDDIVVSTKPKIDDATDLISNFRDAVCHVDTFRKYYGDKAYSFIELRGIQQLQYEPSIATRYADDIGYVMGRNILYLKRHLERAFIELKQIYQNHLGESLFEFAVRSKESA